MEAPSEHCNFWLPRKNRFCANAPLHHSLYCGNHNPKSEQERIPCPLDSSHCVLKQNVEAHVKKCPFLKQAETLRLQPFYKKGINSVGCPDDADDEEPITTAYMKRNAVYQLLPIKDFLELLHKIKSIHASLSHHIQHSYKPLPAYTSWLKKQVDDGKLPFQEKHVLQQASILGNMEEFGILPPSNILFKQQSVSNGSPNTDSRIPAVVEFGAGRGYLTQMLADCYGIRQVFLVERRSYKLKADRSLRQKESLQLQRLRIDIEDLDLHAVESLKAVPYMAIGKHLCGPATDFTLRCCLREHCSKEESIPGDDNHLTGLAIATCCHHLCQWRNYVNKSYLSSLGITKDDFHAITMFTSWAVDADHSSDLCDMVDQRSHLDLLMETKEYGEDAPGVEGIVRDMQPAERAVLGFMCKDIIDVGRLLWIKKHGLGGRFVKYVPSKISPENHLLIAK